MLITLAKKMLTPKKTVPASYLRMVRSEFRTVPVEFVEDFLQKQNRLPTMEELYHAI